MKDAADPPAYPGSDASPLDRLALAHTYHDAARVLFSQLHNDKCHDAPARLCALHAIELYVAAFLSYKGETAGQIRARQHSVFDAEMCDELRLKTRTTEHLKQISEDREYLLARYDARGSGGPSPLNRLQATLNELTDKVRSYIAKDIESSGPKVAT